LKSDSCKSTCTPWFVSWKNPEVSHAERTCSTMRADSNEFGSLRKGPISTPVNKKLKESEGVTPLPIVGTWKVDCVFVGTIIGGGTTVLVCVCIEMDRRAVDVNCLEGRVAKHDERRKGPPNTRCMAAIVEDKT
jgi:hypothetical protein